MTDGRLRHDLPPLPKRLRALPVHRGYPVPWFVAWPDLEPDFRIMDGWKVERAIARRLCMICGQPLGGAPVAFVVGPMCAVNRISAEPPSHIECAEFSARACPFLTRPHMVRREGGTPARAQNPGGVMLRRNPGVALLWVCRDYTLVSDGLGGRLIRMGEPMRVAAFAEGREATREELVRSIATGLPSLEDLARADGPDAERALERQTARALRVLKITPAMLARAREATDAS